MNLPRLAVKRAVTFSMIYAALTGFGIMGLALLPVELFPDITFPMAVVFVDYEGSSPEDIESLVTRPIEEAVSSVSGIKLETDPEFVRPTSVPRLIGNTAKFRELTGWSPKIKFEEILKDTLEYWRDFVRNDLY